MEAVTVAPLRAGQGTESLAENPCQLLHLWLSAPERGPCGEPYRVREEKMNVRRGVVRIGAPHQVTNIRRFRVFSVPGVKPWLSRWVIN
jgi:hypothetical protein